jgi:hypothetical protein
MALRPMARRCTTLNLHYAKLGDAGAAELAAALRGSAVTSVRCIPQGWPELRYFTQRFG